jgi:hypothetical protein
VKITYSFQKLIKKIDRSLSGPLVEFAEQFLYGHRESLCTYAGLPNNAIIKGSVEHGWTISPTSRGIPKLTGGNYLHLVWSIKGLPHKQKRKNNVIAIGAPFLYAYQSVKELLSTSAQLNQDYLERTLFFPYHGNEMYFPNVQAQIESFKKLEDPKKTTVNLYWTEAVNPLIQKQFRDSGFKISCLGFSGMQQHEGLGISAKKHAGSIIGGRHLYLLNLILLLNSHKKVVVGGIGGSVALYAAYMGKNLQFLPEFIVDDLDNFKEYGELNFQMQVMKYIENQMQSKFKNINFSSPRFNEFAQVELGVKNFKSKSELYDILIANSTMVGNPVASTKYLEQIEKFSDLRISVL